MVVDEVMSAWRGAEGKYSAEGLPHVTEIARKPEGVGAEMKALADGESNIMLRLDIMEGKDRQREKPFADVGSEGTAITLRLSQPYFDSGRVIHAHSAFSSVRTCLELRKHGLHFMGCVKTASREFPKRYLASFENQYGRGRPLPRGGWRLLKSNVAPDGSEHEPIYALGWYDRRAKFIVSSCGCTVAAQPSRRKRHRRVIVNNEYETRVSYKEVPRPSLVEEFYSCFSAIDVHDHYRQGSLEMERNWVTRKWYHRIFTTILGICIVDAFYAYKLEMKQAGKDPRDFTYFVGRLAHQLVFNQFLGEGMNLRNLDDDLENDEEVSNLICLYFEHFSFWLLSTLLRIQDNFEVHAPMRISSMDRYKEKGKRIQLACRECKAKTSYYCLVCTTVHNKTVALCSGPSSRDCWVKYHKKS